MDTPKIVVDSNVFVSAALAISGKRLDSPSAVVFFKVVQRDVVAVASPQMLYELAGKLSEPRFELSAAFVIDFINLLADAVEMVAIRGLDMGCRDERDNMFIETAYNGRVDALVTRDRDLQDAQTRYDLAKRKCQILNVTELLAYLREEQAEENIGPEEPASPALPSSSDIETTKHAVKNSTSMGVVGTTSSAEVSAIVEPAPQNVLLTIRTQVG